MNQQEITPSIPKSHKWEHLALGCILALALALRLWGIGFGLPHEYHVDEVQYVRQSATMGSQGLKPVWWNNPPFFKYLLLAQYGGLYLIGRLIGLYTSVAQFGEISRLDPTLLYLIGRATSALLGTLTVGVTYQIVKTTYGRYQGLLASWLLAISFLHVRDSHYAVNDITVTFFVTLVLLASAMILKTGQAKWTIIGGACLGLAFATKYSGVIAVVPYLSAHLASSVETPRAWQRAGRFAKGLLCAAVVAVIVSPYFVLTPKAVLHDIYRSLYLPGQEGFDGWLIDHNGAAIYYARSLIWGLGWPLFAASIVGIPYIVIKRAKASILFVSMPLLFFLTMINQDMYFARFLLPVIPALVICACILTYDAIESLGPASSKIVWLLALLILSALPLAASLRSDYLLTLEDTRTRAKEWVERTIPENSAIACEWAFHCPSLATESRPIPEKARVFRVELIGGAGLADHPVEWYRENEFDYVITSSFISEIPLVFPDRNAERQAFYASLDQEFELIQEFNPGIGGKTPRFIFDEIYGPAVSLWERERPGPVLRVYRVQ